MTDQELIERVVEIYEATESFKKTAAALEISTSKVRKALLTAGVWTNETAEEIAALREKNPEMSDQAIAEHLHISLNTVQMYTPYKAGPYTGDGPSAQRMAEYRGRNMAKVDDVDGNRKQVGDMISKSTVSRETETEADPFDLPLNDTSWYEKIQQEAKEKGLPFARIRHNDNPDAMPYVDDQFYLDYRLVEPAHDNDRHPTIRALRIRLEIDTSNMSASELEMIEKEYGVEKGWTRELIVPSYMPLHYLHYVIQRAFGFENVADHVFQLPTNLFGSITEGALRSYCRLCGVLFRFPFGNDEELYWDEDYDGKKSIRTWLKEKYEGSWNTDAGTGYGYVDNQYRIWKWLGDKVPDFHKLEAALDTYSPEEMHEMLVSLGAPEEYSIGELDEAAVDAIEGRTQFPVNNILESLTLEELLTVDPDGIEFWNFIDDLETAEYELLDNLSTLEKARALMREAQELYKILERRMKSGQWDEDVLLVKKWRKTAKRAAQAYVLARGGCSVPQPFSEELIYLYDFGAQKGEGLKGGMPESAAKWKIGVKVLDEYWDYSIYYSRNYTPSDANGVRFEKDPEHEAEWADRLLDMCDWKEKLEVVDSSDRWIRPENDDDMMIKLRPEQELLDTERERIEKDRTDITAWRLEMGYEKEKEVVVDDRLYSTIRVAMLEHRPVCIGKEGTEPGEGYPDVKVRNSSIENLV